MPLLEPRKTLLPIEYQELVDATDRQNAVHWTHHEFNINDSIVDFRTKLNDTEQHFITCVLRGFTQAELIIEEHWARIASWFPLPEVMFFASTAASMEVVHLRFYSLIDTSLGLEKEMEDFSQHKEVKDKLDVLINCKTDSLEDRAVSLAVFSAFAEGVSLFSNFMGLLSFNKRNLLKSIGKGLLYSIRDENLHSSTGIYLFKTLIKENNYLWTDELKKKIYDAARLTVQLEDSFIERAFEKGPVEGITLKELKNYIRHRANNKLIELGLKTNWKNIDKELLEKISWFGVYAGGIQSSDFFAGRELSYSKNIADFSKIWEKRDAERLMLVENKETNG